jgi:hypothetical protein
MFALSALAVGSAPAHAASLPANTTAILSGDSSLFGELPAPMGSAFSTHQAVSQDGRFIAFDSGADGLSSEDDNSVDNVFVKDTTTGAVTLVSRRSGATGAPSHDQCFDAAISDDGTRVAFTCNGPLDDADTNGHEDVYVRDLTTDQTILVSRKSNQGDLGNGDSFSPSVNQDGTVVAYTSFASNLAGIDVESVYATNLTSHTTTLVSDPPGTTNPPNDTSEHPSVSDDGNLIAFDSRASNFAGDDNNGAPDVFVRNMTTGGVVLASRASGQTGDVGNETSSDPALAGDGSAVAFESSAFNLAPTIDSNGDTDVYVRSLTGNTTSIVDAVGTTKANSFASQPAIDDNGDVVTFQSPATNLGALAGPDGRPAVFAAKLGGTITLASRGDGAGGELATDAEDSSVSGNGRQVVFDSVGSVTGADLPGIETISLRNLAADTTIDVARPPGDAPFDNQAGNSAGGSMSADGRFVAFQSSAPGLGVPPGVETAIVVRDTVTGATVIASRADGPDGAPMTNAIEPSISADGKRVAFVESPAQGSSHVWVRDLATGSTILADRANGGDGAIADGDSDVPSIDGAGDRVAFESDADNLDPDDTDTTFDIFVRDLTTDSTTLASRAVNGDKSNDSSFDPSISATGDHVAFDTFATNLGDGDTDDKQDIHVRDLAEGTTRLASVNTQGEKGDQRSTEASISGDGSRVAFESDATNFGPVPPTTEVWVHDFNTGSTTLASRDDGADGAPASLEAFGPLLSSDGKVVAYSLESGVGELRPAAAPRLHPRGILGQLFFQSFRRDLAANTTALVSRAAGPDGAPADTGVAVGITSDGACVSFDASGGLLGDVPGAEDFDQVYMRTFAADCGRPQTPPPPARDTTAPVLRRVSLTHTKFRVARAATSIGAKRHTKLHRGTQLRFTSSEAAKLTLLIQRAGPGRKLRKGHKSICKPVHSRPKHKACTAYRRTATLTRNIKVGRGQVALSGRIGRRRMAPGHYRLTLTATDGAGNRSKPVRRSFTILAG